MYKNRRTARPTSRSRSSTTSACSRPRKCRRRTPTSSSCCTRKPDKYKGKVTTYDIEKSGVGFMFITQDARVNPQVLGLAKAFGSAEVQLQSSTGAMLERISSGENLHRLQHPRFVRAGAREERPVDRRRAIRRTTRWCCRASCSSPRRRRTRTRPSCGSTTCCPSAARPASPTRPSCYSIRADVEGETTDGRLSKQIGDALKPIPIGTGCSTIWTRPSASNS